MAPPSLVAIRPLSATAAYPCRASANATVVRLCVTPESCGVHVSPPSAVWRIRPWPPTAQPCWSPAKAMSANATSRSLTWATHVTPPSVVCTMAPRALSLRSVEYHPYPPAAHPSRASAKTTDPSGTVTGEDCGLHVAPASDECMMTPASPTAQAFEASPKVTSLSVCPCGCGDTQYQPSPAGCSASAGAAQQNASAARTAAARTAGPSRRKIIVPPPAAPGAALPHERAPAAMPAATSRPMIARTRRARRHDRQRRWPLSRRSRGRAPPTASSAAS